MPSSPPTSSVIGRFGFAFRGPVRLPLLPAFTSPWRTSAGSRTGEKQFCWRHSTFRVRVACHRAPRGKRASAASFASGLASRLGSDRLGIGRLRPPASARGRNRALTAGAGSQSKSGPCRRFAELPKRLKRCRPTAEKTYGGSGLQGKGLRSPLQAGRGNLDVAIEPAKKAGGQRAFERLNRLQLRIWPLPAR